MLQFKMIENFGDKFNLLEPILISKLCRKESIHLKKMLFENWLKYQFF